jgi:hypothetical protein
VHGAHLGVDLGTRMGRKGRTAGGSSALGGGGRGSLGSCVVKARSGLKAAGEASVGAHGYVDVPKQWRPRAGGGAPQQQWLLRSGHDMAACEGEGDRLNRRLSRFVT